MSERNWIVIKGQLVDTTRGGGFEFFGPFTGEEANNVRDSMQTFAQQHGFTAITTIALHLLGVPQEMKEPAKEKESAIAR